MTQTAKTTKLLELLTAYIPGADSDRQIVFIDVLTEHYGPGTRELCSVYVKMIAERNTIGDRIAARHVCAAIVCYANTYDD